MKKLKYLSLLLVVVMICALVFTACDTDDNILWIGNTAATSGGYASVGVPFNIGLEAYLAYYNAEVKGENDQEVRLKHYDDNFIATTGVMYTEKLVEEDKVFALVGHFGTPTVGATLNYIKEQKIPMVYAATGVADLFNANATGSERYILPVQPIFTTEGSILLMRAVTKETESVTYGEYTYDVSVGLGLSKIGVIYTNDDAGFAMQREIMNKLTEIRAVEGYENVDVTDRIVSISNTASEAPAAVAALKNAGVECVIVASNQTPATAIIKAMEAGGLDVPILTSYVNASTSWAGTLGTALSGNRAVYTNAWVDSINIADDVAQFNIIMTEYAELGTSGFVIGGDVATANILGNSFAMAGYIAGATFIEGLIRTIEATDGNITREAYIDAMEAEPVYIPMSGYLDFSNGQRRGIERLSFYAFTHTAGEAAGYIDLTTYRDFKTAAQLLTGIKG